MNFYLISLYRSSTAIFALFCLLDRILNFCYHKRKIKEVKLKKIALFFLIFLFLISCNLKNFDLETAPEVSLIEKTQTGVIINVGEALMAGSIKGTAIVWKEPVNFTPEEASDIWFTYSGSQEKIEKLSGLKGHKVRVIFVYEDYGPMDFQGKRIYVPIIRIIRIVDLGE